jgi:hypothetical protein
MPGESAPSNKDTLGEPSFYKDFISPAITASGHGGGIDMKIMGCVLYSIVGEQTYRQTGFVYSLVTLDKTLNAWNTTVDPYVGIKREDVHLVPIYSSSDMTY